MSGFLYFIPGGAGASPDQLDAAGLSAVLGGCPVLAAQTDAGPQGGGVILAADYPGRAGLSYRPDVQTWVKPGTRTAWLGWEKNAPPAPPDLGRKELLAGHLVQLEDGNQWLAPVARIFPTGLPPLVKLRLGPGGKWVTGDAADRLADLAADAERLWQEWMSALDASVGKGTGATLSLSLEADIAVRALAANYRLGAEEIDALGLFTNENVAKIGLALVDWPSVEAALAERASQKKTPAPTAGPSLTSGGGGSSPDISPPTPMSSG